MAVESWTRQRAVISLERLSEAVKGSVQGILFLLMLLKQEPGGVNCVNFPTVLHKSSLID